MWSAPPSWRCSRCAPELPGIILTSTPGHRCCDYHPVTDKEPQAQRASGTCPRHTKANPHRTAPMTSDTVVPVSRRLSGLPTVTQWVRSGARIQPQACLTRNAARPELPPRTGALSAPQSQSPQPKCPLPHEDRIPHPASRREAPAAQTNKTPHALLKHPPWLPAAHTQGPYCMATSLLASGL